MQGVFDITQFGAVPDGITDATAAIQEALDRAGEVGGVVAVPPGTYLTGELHMHAGTVLRAEDAWGFGKSGTATFLLRDGGAACLLNLSHAANASVRGLCFEGGMLGNGVHGLMICYSEYNGGGHEDAVCIENCRVAHFSGDGLHFYHAWCVSVRQSHLAFNRGAGLFLDGWDAFLCDNWFSGNCSCGIRGGAICSSVTLTANRIEWNRCAGVQIGNGDSLNITGNCFDRSCGPGLSLGSRGTNNLFGRKNYPDCVGEVTVTGNLFRRSGNPMETPFADVYDSAHLRLTQCRNVTVTGNVFAHGCDDDGKGIDSPEYSVVLDGGEYCTVLANPMQNGALTKNIVVLQPGLEICFMQNPGHALHEKEAKRR